MTAGMRKLLNSALRLQIPVFANIPEDEMIEPSGSPLPMLIGYQQLDMNNNPAGALKQELPPTFSLPDGAIGNLYTDEDKYIISLMPSTPFTDFSGTFKYKKYEKDFTFTKTRIDLEFELPE